MKLTKQETQELVSMLRAYQVALIKQEYPERLDSRLRESITNYIVDCHDRANKLIEKLSS